jgi:hypothetical protein
LPTRHAILDFCAKCNIKVPKAFHDLDTIYGIAVVDVSEPEAHRLVAETFYNVPGVLQYFLDRNTHPASYRVLDFKRGTELVLEHPVTLVLGRCLEDYRESAGSR